MKKTVKIISIALIIFALLLNCSMVFATAAPDPSGYTGDSSADVSGITNFGNTIITIISTVGSIASVIVLVVLGLKYMMGSAEEKAEYKRTLMPYVIGAVMVFAASVIAGVIFGFTSNFTGQ